MESKIITTTDYKTTGTHYAYAISSAVRATEMRIIGRNP